MIRTNDVKIVIVQPIVGLPIEVYDTEGYVCFDVQEDFTLNETLSPDTLNVFGNFTKNYLVSSSMIMTHKNHILYDFYGTSEIFVMVYVDGVQLPYESIQMNKISHTDRPFFDISFSVSNPLALLKDLKICDLDFGTFLFSKPNIIQNWNSIDDKATKFMLPVCDYGKFESVATPTKDVLIRDLRPWLREYAVLKAMFSKIGYNFVSTYHDTIEGWRVINYLNGNWKNDNILLDKFSFKIGAINDSPYIGAGVTPITVNFSDSLSLDKIYNDIFNQNNNASIVCYDKGINIGGYLNTTTLEFTGLSGTYAIEMMFWISYGLTGTGRIRIGIQKNAAPITQFYDFFGAANGFIPTRFETEIFTASPSDVFKIFITAAGANLTGTGSHDLIIGKASYIQLKPKDVFLQENLNESINKYINPSYTCIDGLKGVVHAIGGAYLEIDEIFKTVVMRPYSTIENAFDSNLTIEGYYINQQIDIRDVQIADSEIIDYNTDEIKRFQKFKYKATTDEFIKGRTISSDYTFDLGGDFLLQETEESENPFFEPTMLNRNNPLSSHRFPIAALWDNDEGRVSFELNPRRCIFENKIPPLDLAIPNFWAFDNVQQTGYFPTCFMEAEVTYDSKIVKHTLSYKFWGKLYVEKILRQTNFGIMDALFLLSSLDYDQISFRKDYVVYECGNPVIRRLSEVKDFQHGFNIATPLKLY